MTKSRLEAVRRGYAREVMATAEVEDRRIEAAFACVPRERFLGPPPWEIVDLRFGSPFVAVEDAAGVYQDELIRLLPGTGINNGVPSLHARMMAGLDVRPGDRVVHIGAGSGYYTAILAELAGRDGRVTAVEYDARLVERAREALADRQNVRVGQGDGADWPQDLADAVYVNFGVTRPADRWLDRLAPGGRLLIPLGVPRAPHGAALVIERQDAGFAVRWLSPAYFIAAEGRLAGSADQVEALRRAFEHGGIEFVRSLRRGGGDPGRSWFWAADWSLSYDPPGAGAEPPA
ncbi:protein-L-isoaspartate O-methyltransferase family protein [Marinivivus vitaminiproducens]|uniref:protein-L-isoaspartate O-methyltransferase family protein n=1 Tax=Marinivivus vitaminiproducens TaxID=3035935 RepID=UPI0027A7CD5E|nr:rRNA adenine N-6-methyltransferase family protein [Geminicoccaceae bacterium SCSIO 64248]